MNEHSKRYCCENSIYIEFDKNSNTSERTSERMSERSERGLAKPNQMQIKSIFCHFILDFIRLEHACMLLPHEQCTLSMFVKQKQI